ncbi:MAG: rod shape-determining protein RodA [Bryobacterales bacterium]|nr:rod shape-determining protein RodA [Bryobacterales bacterium]
MAHYLSARDLDWALIIITVVICALGILQIYSATHDTKWDDAWWKQIAFVVIGLVLMAIIASIDYHSLMGQVPILYLAGLVLLLAVLLIGTKVFGSRRWIPVLGFTFQVSEFVKLMLILLAARFLTEMRSETLELADLLRLGGLFALPMVLVMRQPDLGTSLCYLPILASGVFLAGLRWKYVLAIALVAIVILWPGYYMLKDYQKARLASFLDPDLDPQGKGYQVIQSKIAVGAGGMWGQGVTRGTQTQLRFLPVAHTDFIFSAFAEEHGFVGVVAVLALYFMLLMQIVQNAQTAPDRAGMYICMGVGALLLFHLLVNVGMVVGRMPVTGIPLPLMSAGGSNTLSTFMMLGLVNNVRLRRFVN